MSPEFLSVAAAAVVGATVGSFLNVCIYRLPRQGLSITSPPRSHCTSCGFEVPWHDNLPLLSWLWLGGYCRSCRAPISRRYLVVEALTAMAFAVLAHRYFTGPDRQLPLGVALSALTAALIVVAFIDQELQIIPDEITLPGMMSLPFLAVSIPGLHSPPSSFPVDLLARLEPPFARAAAALPPALSSTAGLFALPALAALLAASAGLFGYRLYWRWAHPEEPKRLRDCALAAVLSGSAAAALAVMLLRPPWVLQPPVVALWSTLIGMAAGSGLVFLVGLLGRQLFRKDAMGFGDVKLMGLLGGFAGWKGVLAGFALACLLGSLVGVYRLLRYRSRYLPFGPYLVAASLVLIVWPEAFERALLWYMRLIRALGG